jgi:antitoxin CptB
MNSKSTQYARLKWRCRRGMKELDLFLIPFIEKGFQTLSEPDIATLEILLEEPDPDLYSWLSGYCCPLNPDWEALCEKIREHHHL